MIVVEALDESRSNQSFVVASGKLSVDDGASGGKWNHLLTTSGHIAGRAGCSRTNERRLTDMIESSN